VILLYLLLGYSLSPADSVNSLITIRTIPAVALHYAQMAAAEDGAWVLEYGRILEAAGEFTNASRVYGLAVGNSTSDETTKWLLNRRTGTLPLDTTLTITTTISNRSEKFAWGIQVIIPLPVSHPPYQSITITQNDFRQTGGMLSAYIPFIPPDKEIKLSLTLDIYQEPFTMRPITQALANSTLNWLTEAIRNMPIPDILPGPCVPMSKELQRLAAEQNIPLRIEGGLVLDTEGFIFHAWNVIDSLEIRIDPLLFKEDSLLGIAHNPSDVIPLWNLETTDGYELNILYNNPNYNLNASMEVKALLPIQGE